MASNPGLVLGNGDTAKDDPITEKTPNSVTSPPAEKRGPPPEYSAIPLHRKYFIRFIVTLTGFLGPLSGNIYFPALPVLADAFHVSNAAINATVSVFMVVFAIGPLLWATQADKGGRRPLYLISLVIFILANIILAAVPAHFAVLIIFRIIQAFGACCVISMGAGTIADITEPAKRAFAMSIFLMGPQLGPVLGPVLGGALAGAASWRWIFGFLAILAFCIWLLILFALPETLRYRVGNGRIYQGKSFLIFPPTLSSRTIPDEQRGPKPPKPTAKMFWNLFLYPPIGIVSFNSSLLFAGFYSIATSQPSILGERYHWSTVEVGLAYLAPGLAMVSGSLIGGRFSDWHRAHLLRKTENGTVEPETRLMNQIWGVLVAASGTLIYGWTTQYRVHPAVVLIATSLAGGGMSWVFVTSTSYCTEVVPAQAAAVVALGNMLRNPAAAVAAAIIEPLTNSMGLGWCFTGLALLELIVVGGLVILLRIRSPYWRRQRVARFAAAKRPGPSQPPK